MATDLLVGLRVTRPPRLISPTQRSAWVRRCVSPARAAEDRSGGGEQTRKKKEASLRARINHLDGCQTWSKWQNACDLSSNASSACFCLCWCRVKNGQILLWLFLPPETVYDCDVGGAARNNDAEKWKDYIPALFITRRRRCWAQLQSAEWRAKGVPSLTFPFPTHDNLFCSKLRQIKPQY